MTELTMALRALLEKSADADLLHEMVGFTAQRLMDLEAATQAASPLRDSRRSGINGAFIGYQPHIRD